MRVLLTAFEPFGGEGLNPSLEALRKLPDSLDGLTLHKQPLPTAYSSALHAALKAFGEIQPDAILCLGQAGGRAGLTVERVAINLMEAEQPDNEGFLAIGQPIASDGPAAYFTTLPVLNMKEAILRAGVPAAISYSAGAYVCNYLLYGLLHALDRMGSYARAGFIHLPFLPSQAAGKKQPLPSLPLEEQIRGVRAALSALGRG